MKVYVDKIPKYCLDCVCCDLDLEECKIDKKIELCQGYFNSFEKKKPTKCPLQALSDYAKQVRNEVCEEIKQKIEKRNNGTRNANYSVEYKDGYSGCCCDLEHILDQIQGVKNE